MRSRNLQLMKSFGIATVLATCAVMFAGGLQTNTAQADEALERLKEQGFARIAIANEPPFTEVKPDGKVTGAAVEIARAVLERLGVPELVASVSEYGAMIPGVQARRFDMIAAGLFIKPERCKAILFSEPDLCDSGGFAVKTGNPLGLMTYGDIANHATAKVGGPGGGSEVKLAIDAGVPQDRIVIVPDGQSGIKMLMDGRIDVYALPALSIADLLDKADSPDLDMVAPVKDAPVFCAGVGFHKKDRALRDAYDVVLAELKSSGEFSEIVSGFGFPPEAASLTTRDKLCGFEN